jgi:hypothetical protein
MHSFIRLFIHSFIYSLIYSFIYSLIYLFTHLFAYLYIHSFIYSLIYLFAIIHPMASSYEHFADYSCSIKTGNVFASYGITKIKGDRIPQYFKLVI